MGASSPEERVVSGLGARVVVNGQLDTAAMLRTLPFRLVISPEVTWATPPRRPSSCSHQGPLQARVRRARTLTAGGKLSAGSRPGTASLPGHLGFSHPQEVHVTGQHGQVGVGGCRQAGPRVPVAEEDVHDQLQARLPAHGLPEEEHPCEGKDTGVRVQGSGDRGGPEGFSHRTPTVTKPRAREGHCAHRPQKRSHEDRATSPSSAPSL